MDQDDVSDCSSTVSSVGEEEHEEDEEEEHEEDEEEEVSSKSSSNSLQNMSSLLQELPIKRGLSKHYNGKSQSFTSLSAVECLEDLAKPENPLNKRLKTCKSYAVFPRNNMCSSRFIAQRGSQFGCTSNRPPIAAPYRSASTSNFANHTSLFT